MENALVRKKILKGIQMYIQVIIYLYTYYYSPPFCIDVYAIFAHTQSLCFGEKLTWSGHRLIILYIVTSLNPLIYVHLIILLTSNPYL